MAQLKQHQSKSDKQAKPAVRQQPQQSTLDLQTPSTVESILQLQRLIGNKATTALIQRQDEEEGSATVAGAATVDETAADSPSYTDEVTDDQDADSTPTDEELTGTLKKEATEAHIVADGNQFHTQHPSFAQMGIRPKEILGDKAAVYIGNSNYKNNEWWGTLGAVPGDVERMKSTMKEHKYSTIKSSKDLDSKQIGSVFKGAMRVAKKGDALLLYYAGHGLPDGMVGVKSNLKAPEAKAKNEEGGAKTRGVKLVSLGDGPTKSNDNMTMYEGHEVSDVEKYDHILGILEEGVNKGVHSTFISDACHSGAATDLVRDKAVEKVAKSENPRVKAATEQIARLKDMKKQIPKEGAKGEGEGEVRGLKLSGKPMTLEESEASPDESKKSPFETYWDKVVEPELKELSKYLKEAGMSLATPKKPADFSKGGLEQVIDQFINQLVDLGEKIQSEEKKPTLSIAP